jgi:type II secretory pathway component PulK
MTPACHRPSLHRANSGSALLLALWALLVIAAAVLAWARYIDAEITLSNQANRGLEAKALAHSGFAVALKVEKGSPLLTMEDGPDRGYKVRMIGEAGKLNVKVMFESFSPDGTMLKQYFGMLGMDFRDQDILIDSLRDWIDPDSEKQINGMEASGDYHPPNRGYLASLDEIEQVHGADALRDLPGWQDGLTIYGDGKIDVLSADLNVLKLIPGVSERAAMAFLALRRGRDGEDGTEDDYVFKNLPTEAMQYLGLTGANAEAAGAMISFNSKLWRIESVGKVGDIERQVEAVVQMGGGPGSQNATIYSWKEK